MNARITRPRKRNIPTCSTGPEALSVVAFLESIIINIWDQHGDHMIEEYRKAEALSTYANLPSRFQRDGDSSDDDSEFPF